LGDAYALTAAEQTAVVTARATYSGVIAGIAAAIPGVVMFDVQPLFADVAGLTPTQAAQLALTSLAQSAADGVQGIKIDGYNYAPDFSPNGLFSTDGVHPNPKGHAYLTNQIIQTINKEFGSTIPEVDLVPFRTVITTTD
jgi:lysophospholipase L1-like esterase